MHAPSSEQPDPALAKDAPPRNPMVALLVWLVGVVCEVLGLAFDWGFRAVGWAWSVAPNKTFLSQLAGVTTQFGGVTGQQLGGVLAQMGGATGYLTSASTLALSFLTANPAAARTVVAALAAVGGVTWVGGVGGVVSGATELACSYTPAVVLDNVAWARAGCGGEAGQGQTPPAATFAAQFQVDRPWGSVPTAQLDSVGMVVQMTHEAITALRQAPMEEEGGTAAGGEAGGGMAAARENRLAQLAKQAEQTLEVVFDIKKGVGKESDEAGRTQGYLLGLLEVVMEAPIAGRSGWQRFFDEYIGGGGSDRRAQLRRIDQVWQVINQTVERRTLLGEHLGRPLPLAQFCFSQEGGPRAQAGRAKKRDKLLGRNHEERVSAQKYYLERGGGSGQAAEDGRKMRALIKNVGAGILQHDEVKAEARIKMMCAFCQSVKETADRYMELMEKEGLALETASKALAELRVDFQSTGVLVSKEIINDTNRHLERITETLLEGVAVRRRVPKKEYT
ncbi:hypothetical protein QBC39DRAFT_385912 [Podospora conica]|nr:hypothetical protein QBC39DRAFT_385912 [Schizothecium conicum]